MTVPSDSEKPDKSAARPSSCIADHAPQESLEDQWHGSNASAVPVVECWSCFVNNTLRPEADGVELNVLLSVEDAEVQKLFARLLSKDSTLAIESREWP